MAEMVFSHAIFYVKDVEGVMAFASWSLVHFGVVEAREANHPPGASRTRGALPAKPWKAGERRGWRIARS